MKTSELTGAALDWMVAKCEGYIDNPESWMYQAKSTDLIRTTFHPSKYWAQGGPIIERETIAIDFDGCLWCASDNTNPLANYGGTALIAAMRCYVASKMGDEIEIPGGLT